ncbi:MAG: hypothetical protein HW375_1075, partial [Anaerolineales bacterium]|nr:hypothetical protein [Anaerolineales bacterium]
MSETGDERRYIDRRPGRASRQEIQRVQEASFRQSNAEVEVLPGRIA